MDLLRGIAIFMVMLLHTAGPLDDNGHVPPHWLLWLNDALAPFRIPTLVFLSGFLLKGSMAKGMSRFATGKLYKIGWPYLLWTGVFLVVVGDVTVRTYLKVFYDPPTYLWYMFFLLAYYFMAYVLLTLLPMVPNLVVGVASLVLTAFMPEDGRSQRFFFLFAFFLAGDWAARNPEVWKRWIAQWWLVALGLVVGIVGGALGVHGTLVRYQPEYAWSVVGVLIVAVRFSPALTRTPLAGPLEFFGRNSLIFYVVHLPAILTAAKILRRGGINNPEVLAFAGITAAIATGCFFIFAQRALPAVEWLFAFPAQLFSRSQGKHA